MLHIIKNENERLYYWTDWKGDCYADDGSLITFDELPWELRKIFKKIGAKYIGGLCYFLAEYNDEYGVACDYLNYIKNSDIDADVFYENAINKAQDIAEALPDYNIIVKNGKSTNGTECSTITLFVPWTVKESEFEEIIEKFESYLNLSKESLFTVKYEDHLSEKEPMTADEVANNVFAQTGLWMLAVHVKDVCKQLASGETWKQDDVGLTIKRVN